MLSSTRLTSLGIFMLAGMLFLSGCATKGYVNRQIEPVTADLAKVSDATTENAERIDAVDQRATQGIAAARSEATTQFNTANAAAKGAQDTATAAANDARTANTAVGRANERMTQIANSITNGLGRYNIGQPNNVMFTVGSSTLSPEAMATLDMVATQVSSNQGGYLVEIQGFADATGSETSNIALSQRRAEAVLRYLVSKRVPLYRVAILGLGEVNPIADNSTREGREQNRRVEVRVLTPPPIQVPPATN